MIIVNGLQLLAYIDGVLETGVYFLLPALYRNLDDFFFSYILFVTVTFREYPSTCRMKLVVFHL